MKITVNTRGGFVPDKYSKYSDTKVAGQPVVSFPIKVDGLPENTKYLAISLIDYDAAPVAGFPFIHWLAANVPAGDVPEDFSLKFDGPQGKNSWSSRFYNVDNDYIVSHYAGPMPPEKPHRYTLTVYALKSKLSLSNGFYYNDFRDALSGQVVDSATVDLKARN